MIADVLGPLLRAVPDELVAGVASGQYRVAGSIVQSVATGRIVGHLQETALLPSLLGRIVGGGIAAPISAVTGVVDVVQNEQIKAGLALVQELQWANLALTGAGIGVSIAGTAMLMHQINRLSRKVDDLQDQLAEVARDVRQLQAEPMRHDFARMGTLCAQVDEAWSPTAQDGEWRDIARDAHFLADQFKSRASSIGTNADPQTREPFVNAYALASNLRVTARMAAAQDDMAHAASEERAENLLALGAPTHVAALLAKPAAISAAPGTHAWLTAWRTHMAEVRAMATAAREREIQAAACVETLTELQTRKIAGRDWLAAARAERDAPLLFLPVSEAAAA